MRDATNQILQWISQIALCGGVALGAFVAARLIYLLVLGRDRADRAEAMSSVIWSALAAAPLLAAPVIIGYFAPAANQEGATSSGPIDTTPTDTTPTDWTPWLWALGTVALVGLIVCAVKVGKNIKKRRKVRKAADAKVVGAQAQEHEHWQNAVRRHDALRAQFYALESDPMARLTMPAFWDFTRPLSIAWWDAQGAADNRRTEQIPADPAWRHEYADVVDRAARAFAAARDDARRVGLTVMETSERRRVERAQKALSTVLDDASTEAERRVAYRVVLDSISGIVDLPPVMRHQLTARTGRELTAAEQIGQPAASGSAAHQQVARTPRTDWQSVT